MSARASGTCGSEEEETPVSGEYALVSGARDVADSVCSPVAGDSVVRLEEEAVCSKSPPPPPPDDALTMRSVVCAFVFRKRGTPKRGA